MGILAKRNGQFPRKISDVKYNDYIKEVCKRAGLTQKVEGSKKIETSPESKQYRKEEGIYPKWELVSSHIGRRSFATNFYGTIPATFLIYITGNLTGKMFLEYIGKSNRSCVNPLHNSIRYLSSIARSSGWISHRSCGTGPTKIVIHWQHLGVKPITIYSMVS